jgi:hypothetical protein
MDTLSETRRKAEQAKQHLKDFKNKCEGKDGVVEDLKNMFGMNGKRNK